MPARFGPYSALEVMRVRRMFNAADVDGSGDVELDELLNSAEWRAAYSLDQIRDFFDAMDTDGSGKITAAELFRVTFPNANARARKLMLKWTDPRRTARTVIMAAPKRVVNTRTRLEAEEVFSALDGDRDGFVSVDDVADMLVTNHSKSEAGLWSLADARAILAKYAIGGEQPLLSSGRGKGGGGGAAAAAVAGATRRELPEKHTGKLVMDRLGFIRMSADNFFDFQSSGGRA
jgi:Ca2+-binding EF-hand superfamily protein